VRTFNLERGKATERNNSGRSYFISRLLREVVLRESGLIAPL
jgi:hypothetical protein